MRSYRLSLAALLFATSVHAQLPPQPPQNTTPPMAVPPAAAAPAAPNPARLDQMLQRWEQEMKNVQSLSADLHRTTRDKTFGRDEVFTGTAKYMKPNYAVLEMKKKDSDLFEKYLCSGQFLYEYVPAVKKIRVHELPQPKAGQVSEDNFLSFLFGMKAEEAKKRYDLRLVKEDQYYVYIEILPKFPADKVDFQKARLILSVSNYLPRQVWFEQPNGNEITWDVPKINAGVSLPKTDFQPPTQLPAGWTMEKMPRSEAVPKTPEPAPRVVRPQQ